MSDSLFKELGIEAVEVLPKDVSLGKTYPLFGVITGYLEEENSIVINYGMKFKLNSSNKADTAEKIKERMYDSAILVCSFNKIDETVVVPMEERLLPTADTTFPYEGECTTLVLGKKQTLQ